MSRGREKKKKPVQKWQGNKAVFNARNSFLSTVRRSLETGAAESAREALLGRLEKKNWGLCLALLAFTEMLTVRTMRRFRMQTR